MESTDRADTPDLFLAHSSEIISLYGRHMFSLLAVQNVSLKLWLEELKMALIMLWLMQDDGEMGGHLEGLSYWVSQQAPVIVQTSEDFCDNIKH